MSILIKPYEISVWDDVWNGVKFEEKRLGIIGTEKMTSLNRALEPNLVRNVNGTKTFTFKMYKYYKDIVTGENVYNPFVDWLVSERKVKLKYGKDINGKDRWYDFIVKNISETSTNYLYSYQLEDATVLELSKNGFGIVLNAELMNNSGTAKELAEEVLKETDWSVQSEAFVQTIEENLVYVKFPSGTYNKITDQQSSNYNTGISSAPVSLTGGTALAFYSSCKNKPHRFQFIYLTDYTKGQVETDKRVIQEKDCQYYLEVNQQSEYVEIENGKYYLPSGWTLETTFPDDGKTSGKTYDTLISNWYRGKRYGYSQTTKYIPLIERYCNLYEKSGQEYYGYVDNEYVSPAFVQNVITSAECEDSSGWLGTYKGPTGNLKSSVGTKVENVYGIFTAGKFHSVIDDLANGTYDEDTKYQSYLKVTFPKGSGENTGILINSGFYDNRTVIGSVDYDEQWYLDFEIYDKDGAKLGATDISSKFNFHLNEVGYNTLLGNYSVNKIWATGNIVNKLMQFNSSTAANSTHADVHISENEFKKKNIRLVIDRKSSASEEIFYFKKAELYKKILNEKNQIITPGTLDTDGVVKTYYKFFKKSDLTSVTNKEDLVLETVETINYGTYIPKYVEGAQKVRSVTVQESNYFNILQSIAETFECWVDLKITRNSLGAIQSKTVCLKNYIGKDNYANFRYGVNLKDIQRTYESKNIVTKLIVKQNSNEHAQNGFCTIARAGMNPTGENYIYDFQYFHGRDMLKADDYTGTLYYETNPNNSSIKQAGPDLGNGHESEEYNIQNYVNRVKNINDKLKPIAENITSLSADLTKFNADLKVQEGLRDAASSNIEEVREDFYVLTGLMPDQISAGDFSAITCAIPSANLEGSGVNVLNSGKTWAQNATVGAEQVGAANSTTWKFNITLADMPTQISHSDPTTFGTAEWSGGQLTCKGAYDGLIVVPKDTETTEPKSYEANKRYVLEYKIQKLSEGGGTLQNVGSHCLSFRNVEVWFDGVKTDGSIVNVSDDTNLHTVKIVGTFYERSDYTKALCIQPNRGSTAMVKCAITDITLYEYSTNASSKERTLKIQPTFTLTQASGNTITKTPVISCTIPADTHTTSYNYSLAIVDTTASSVANLLQEYAHNKTAYKEAVEKIGSEAVSGSGLAYTVKTKKDAIEAEQENRKKLLEHKENLNKCFYKKYYRFIQEGTWMSEEYVDDDKYYADAQSVMYNSCYPQVAYTINVLSMSGLPGYEMMDFEIGDKTYAIDPEFFGEQQKEEVVIAEMSERLDDPSKNTMRVQNFKNQFQDLFQKITATVQQTQYSTGDYKKAAALANADEKTKNKFIHDGLQGYGRKLTVAGQTTVTQDESGITLTDSATKDQMRLIGGAIMMSVEDEETGERKWKTGLTPEGISASLVTAGTINAGNISIMNVNDPVFRWDAYGLSAFDADWSSNGTIGTPNPYKFVRFDKYGIYGIDTNSSDTNAVYGTTWKPSSNEEIDEKATFALTWEGLKVTGDNQAIARIGKQGSYIMIVKDSNGKTTFRIKDDGSVEMAGKLNVGGTLDDATPQTLENYVNTTKQAAITAATNAAKEYANDLAEGLQSQIDGEITSWFYAEEPTTDNEPAKNWTTENEKIRHEGDLYYNTATGAAYRWIYNNDDKAHEWTRITDEAIAEALAEAKDAKDAANEKVTLYASKPEEYRANDLWILDEETAESEECPGVRTLLIGETDAELNEEWIEADEFFNDSVRRLYYKYIEMDPAFRDVEYIKCSIINQLEDIEESNLGDLIYYNGLNAEEFETHNIYYYTGANWEKLDYEEVGAEIRRVFSYSRIWFVERNDWYEESTLWLVLKKYSVGTLLVAINDSSENGEYSLEDWFEKTRYTDDTAANEAYDRANQAYSRADRALQQYTTLSDDISNADGIFATGLSKKVNKTELEKFGLTAKSLIVYNQSTTENEVDRIFSAETMMDEDGNFTPGGAVYLAGWTVTGNQLSYCPEGTSIGQDGTFGIYPKGISAESLTGFGGALNEEDKWVLTAGNDFGITANGMMFSRKGKIAGWEIDNSGIQKGGVILTSGNDLYLPSYTGLSDSPIRLGAQGVAPWKESFENSRYLEEGYEESTENIQLDWQFFIQGDYLTEEQKEEIKNTPPRMKFYIYDNFSGWRWTSFFEPTDYETAINEKTINIITRPRPDGISWRACEISLDIFSMKQQYTTAILDNGLVYSTNCYFNKGEIAGLLINNNSLYADSLLLSASDEYPINAYTEEYIRFSCGGMLTEGENKLYYSNEEQYWPHSNDAWTPYYLTDIEITGTLPFYLSKSDIDFSQIQLQSNYETRILNIKDCMENYSLTWVGRTFTFNTAKITDALFHERYESSSQTVSLIFKTVATKKQVALSGSFQISNTGQVYLNGKELEARLQAIESKLPQ